MGFASNISSKSSVSAVILGAAMAFGASNAMAASCDVGACSVAGVDGQNLSGGVSFSISEITNDTGTGDFNFEANFNNDSASNAAASTTVLQFKPTNLASINNLFLSVISPSAAQQSFQITNATGQPINLTGFDVTSVFDLSAASNQLISFALQGEAVKSSGGLNPGIQMTISAVPIPLPAGGLLLLTALGGVAALRRRRKVA